MSAWDLHKAWPEADLQVIQDAGHSANEPGIAAELVAANEKLKHIKKGAWENKDKTTYQRISDSLPLWWA
ncbi:unnamed protein product [Prunus brigantina]